MIKKPSAANDHINVKTCDNETLVARAREFGFDLTIQNQILEPESSSASPSAASVPRKRFIPVVKVPPLPDTKVWVPFP